MNEEVYISPGNMKLGSIPNISLPPIKSCLKGVPCGKDCYAMKAYRNYPNVRKRWDSNLALYKASVSDYFSSITQWLQSHKQTRFFRWHVAGDIQDMDYLVNMIWIAEDFPDIKFLVFTKRHDLLQLLGTDNRTRASNLTLIASMWPGFGDLRKLRNFRKAWMQDGTEKHIPKTALICPGSCEGCGACFSLGQTKHDVVFHKH